MKTRPNDLNMPPTRRLRAILISTFLCAAFVASNRSDAFAWSLSTRQSNDTSTVKYLNDQARDLMEREPQKALDLAYKALPLAQLRGDMRGYSVSLVTIATVLKNTGSYQRAIELFEKAVTVNEDLKDRRSAAILLTTLGILYRDFGSYQEAIAANNKAMQYYKSLEMRKEQAQAHNALGGLYRATANYDAALKDYEEAEDILDDLGDSKGLSVTYGNLAVIYEKIAKYDKALKNNQKAMALAEKSGDVQTAVEAMNNIGRILHLMGRHPEALATGKNALQRSRETGLVQESKNALEVMSDAFSSMGIKDSALLMYKSAAALNDTLFRLNTEREKRELADLKKKFDATKIAQQTAVIDKDNEIRELRLRETDRELAFLKLDNENQAIKQNEKEARIRLLEREKALQLAQKKRKEKELLVLQGEKKIADLMVFQNKMEAENKEKQNQILKKDNEVKSEKVRLQQLQIEQARLRMILLTAGIVFVGVLALVLFNRYNIKRKSEENLKLKNEELQTANNEILRQQSILEEQAVDIEVKNTQLQETLLVQQQLMVEKNEFLGIVAHDLKNPLAGIILSTQTMRKFAAMLKPEDVASKLEGMENTAKRMREIVGNLLEIAQLESGTYAFKTSVFDSADLMRGLVSDFAASAQVKNITIHGPSAEKVAMIKADQAMTKEIAENLVSNAIKFSPFEKDIWLDVLDSNVAPDEFVQLRVRDMGPGLTDEDKSKLFGKFARLSAKPTGGEHSTGLGLSIVKKLVEGMNGKVWCESTPGHGATFVVELPKA